MAYNPEVPRIADNEHVDAAHTNKPIDRLAQQVAYLKAQIDSLTQGSQLVRTNVTLASDVEVGHVVYYDSTNEQYARALLAYDYDETGRLIVPAESSYVQGIVTEIDGTKGTIVTGGYLSDFDLSNTVIDAEASAGSYYLSQSHAGQLESSLSTLVGALVLIAHSSDSGAFYPTYRNLLEDHVHVRLELTAVPAGNHDPAWTGTQNIVGKTHEITSPDDSLEGWLPVSEFDAAIVPSGAAFGYNVAADDYLSQNFPPIPLDNVYVELDGQGLSSDFLQVDENGIWWMSDCYGHVPWEPNRYYTAGVAGELYNPTNPTSSDSDEVEEVDQSFRTPAVR